MNGCEARSLLHPYLLLLIYERPGHGYDLIDRLSCLGVSDVEPGHAYRVLRGMERARLVVSTWVPSEAGPARRRYELTDKGVADLEAWAPKLAHLGEVITSFLARWNQAARAAAPVPGGGGREPRAVSWT
ncbi:helix-turn-helix transcriptional regulator [Actinomadura algeriensis]|uniref:Poly-beta-hydroxybutyrate-responsive repressor n=1 Tax=Actinomadura algeriensis TaxID=1679523 RepID=A0ABR9JNN9_9ACTN|nr:helix-turn-helix transcriptional regulator [Actinomadura algeriensis]MBE1532175.1 poly-beta-hydroxybutyrate-responsive repressor [Actinomadura algeriensis]